MHRYTSRVDSPVPAAAPVAKFYFENIKSDPSGIGAIYIYPDQVIKIGRDPNPDKNDIVLSDPAISRCHLEFYSILFDQENKHRPLVSVRDCKSLNGTSVNNERLGVGMRASARLLEDGDIIHVGPVVQLRFTQLYKSRPGFAFTSRQRQELELFGDKYLVTNRSIGDGANAVVYLAYDVRSGNQVVCKVIDTKRLDRSAKGTRRILQEAVLLNQLDHPNVLAFYGAFQSEQYMYIITEFATGGDLFSLIARKKVFDELEICMILYQVLLGVSYLHDKGVAHRDIKPENILCADAPRIGHRIMLSDLGDAAISSRGRMTSFVGTSHYRAPFPVDMWSVGMLCMQIFTGHKNVPRPDDLAFRNQRELDDYLNWAFPRVRPSGQMSENAENFVRRCLTYHPERRMTANEALRHPWFSAVGEVREILTETRQQAFVVRSARKIVHPAIERLPETPRNIESDDDLPSNGEHLKLAERISLRPRYHTKTRGEANFSASRRSDKQARRYGDKLGRPPSSLRSRHRRK